MGFCVLGTFLIERDNMEAPIVLPMYLQLGNSEVNT